ncbi:MAG: hypothetical protein V3U60_11225 [Gammaproteobacteria bacterium]
MTDYPEAFESLWSVWPKRDGRKGKKFPAFKKWQALDSSQKAALLACTEKHNRQHSWGKYIRDLLTFINQRGWEDIVDDPKTFEPAYHTAPEPPHPGTKWEATANKCLRDWLRAGGGVPVDRLPEAIDIKNACVAEMSAALDEDIEKATTQHEKTEPFWTFRNVLIDRLDQAFGRELKPLLLKGAANDTPSI